ncbi:MAG: TRAM domain-containing protein, partial [Nitrospinota bacterium]
KKERNSIIKNLGRWKSDIFRRNSIGKICRLLIENTRDRETGMLKGYTDNYIPVILEGGDKLMNKLINIRITDLSADAVTGELIDESK